MPKIIIRTINGNPLPEPVRNSVCAMASIDPANIKIVYEKSNSSNEEWQAFSTKERIHSATKAFQLMCRVRGDDLALKLIDYVELLEKDYSDLSAYLTRLDCLACQALGLNSIDFKKQLSLAENYVVATTEKPILATVILDTDTDKNKKIKYRIQMEVPESPFSAEMEQEFNAIREGKSSPRWYELLSPEEKDFFINSKNLQVLSSKHRTVPGVANFLRHHCAVLDSDGEIIFERPIVFRSSMAASRDIPTSEIKTREEFTLKNYQHIIATAKERMHITSEIKPLTLLQTLISPIRIAKSAMPDSDLYIDKQSAVTSLRSTNATIINLNHPLNPARKFLATEMTAEIIAFFNGMTLNVTDSRIKMACEELNSFKNNHPQNRGFGLHVAALTEFIVSLCGGICHGSCVSGKDRKGLETIYVDAIFLYYEKYKKLPRLDDADNDRQNFCNIYAALYVTHHQHTSAGLNAPGANGIKAPDRYLPQDILAAIKVAGGDVELSNKIADTNEFDHVKYKVEENPSIRKTYELHTAAYINNIGSYKDEGLKTKVHELMENIKSTNWDRMGLALFGRKTPAGIVKMRASLQGKVLSDSATALSILVELIKIAEAHQSSDLNDLSPQKKFYNDICLMATDQSSTDSFTSNSP